MRVYGSLPWDKRYRQLQYAPLSKHGKNDFQRFDNVMCKAAKQHTAAATSKPQAAL
jgi:hypothetical protein